MPAERTDAIVLRLIEFSETSLIVTLLTRDFGRVTAIAKGARRAKGPFEGSLDLLSMCDVVLYRKSAGTLDLLTESKLARRFRAASRSLSRLHCGYYVAEMLRLWTDDHDPHPELFSLAEAVIHEIDGNEDELSAVIRFELQAMRILGAAPSTRYCVRCGADCHDDGSTRHAVVPYGNEASSGRRKASAGSELGRITFAHELGGVVCGGCRAGIKSTVSLRRALLARIERLQQAPAPALGESAVREASVAEPLAARDYAELRAVLNRYISLALGNPPRTQSLLPARLKMD